MRKSIRLTVVFAVMGFASFAHGQLDLAVGGSTVWSSKNTTASVGFLPPAEKGGMYPGAYAEYRLWDRFGISAEGAYRYHKTFYNGFQPYRPIFYDVNGVFAPRFTENAHGDFMAGVGGESLLFYNTTANCGIRTGGCRTFLNSTHFAVHAGAGVRYYFWRNFYARPEAHWYFVPNNFQFHSNHVYRIGVSLGHTFGSR